MARVTVEDCIDKVDNRFELVLMASHRARAISSGSNIFVARDNDKNPVVALREIADSKLHPRLQGRPDSPCKSTSKSTNPRPRKCRRFAARAFVEPNAGAEAQFDRMTEEDLLRGLEGMAPPPERDEDAE